MYGRSWRISRRSRPRWSVSTPAFSKYQRLLAYLQVRRVRLDRHDPADRLVVFSERLETLRWLHGQLQHDLRLKTTQIALLHGQLSDTEQQELVDRFGRLDDPMRVLLCSDVASEGLNLHYFCHRLVHFDLPWSLMVFQQRNGRVDRYGQKHRPADRLPVHRDGRRPDPRRPPHPGNPADRRTNRPT